MAAEGFANREHGWGACRRLGKVCSHTTEMMMGCCGDSLEGNTELIFSWAIFASQIPEL